MFCNYLCIIYPPPPPNKMSPKNNKTYIVQFIDFYDSERIIICIYMDMNLYYFDFIFNISCIYIY